MISVHRGVALRVSLALRRGGPPDEEGAAPSRRGPAPGPRGPAPSEAPGRCSRGVLGLRRSGPRPPPVSLSPASASERPWHMAQAGGTVSRAHVTTVAGQDTVQRYAQHRATETDMACTRHEQKNTGTGKTSELRMDTQRQCTSMKKTDMRRKQGKLDDAGSWARR